jgi:hypothetical protein
MTFVRRLQSCASTRMRTQRGRQFAGKVHKVESLRVYLACFFEKTHRHKTIAHRTACPNRGRNENSFGNFFASSTCLNHIGDVGFNAIGTLSCQGNRH